MISKFATYSCAVAFAPVLTCSYFYGESALSSSGRRHLTEKSNAQVKALATLPLSFEKNLGQVGHRRILLLMCSDEPVFLSSSGISFAPYPRLDPGTQPAPTGGPGTLQVQFSGANLASRPVPVGLQPGVSNYFSGSSEHWITHVPNFTRVRYADVYQGVDVEYYGNGQELEYDMAIAPSADPRRIVLQLAGSDTVVLTQAGDVIATRGETKLRLNRPIAYQMIDGKKQLVSARYVPAGAGRATFHLGAYDRSRILIIDPKVIYSTFVPNGGGLVAVDGNENAY